MRMNMKVLGLVALFCMAIGAWGFSNFRERLAETLVRLSVSGPLSVERVIDGDSFVVVTHLGRRMEVRPIGINAKELRHAGLRISEECWGPEGLAYAKTLLDGTFVRLTFDPAKGTYDDHRRLLAYVTVYERSLLYPFSSGFDFNKRMIETGNAEEWQYRGSYQRAAEYLAAETKAREENLGGWARCPDFKKHPRKSTGRRHSDWKG